MWNLLLPALAIAGGTYLAANANNSAAAAYTNTANSIAAENQQIAAPAQSYLRSLIVSPDTLTPAQTKQLQLNRLAIANQIHGSEFAGSGRTAEALFKGQDSDFINTALDQNKNKAVAAADTLQGRQTAADTALLSGAQTNATATLANGKLIGGALGDVSSLISRQSKLSSLN